MGYPSQGGLDPAEVAAAQLFMQKKKGALEVAATALAFAHFLKRVAGGGAACSRPAERAGGLAAAAGGELAGRMQAANPAPRPPPAVAPRTPTAASSIRTPGMGAGS